MNLLVDDSVFDGVETVVVDDMVVDGVETVDVWAVLFNESSFSSSVVCTI